MEAQRTAKIVSEWQHVLLKCLLVESSPISMSEKPASERKARRSQGAAEIDIQFLRKSRPCI